MDKINNQRVEEVATKLYKRLSERASQKFDRIDESFLHDYKLDEDGLIPFNSFWETVATMYGQGISKNTARKIFKLTDKDNDGKISINEVRMEYNKANMKLHIARNIDITKLRQRKKGPVVDKIVKQIRKVYKDKSSLLNVFRAADEDHNGYVNEVEMQHVLNGLGLETSLKECGELCDYFDVDEDGKIEYDEFIAFISSQNSNILNEIHNQEHEAKGIPEGMKELHRIKQRLLDRNESLAGPVEKTVGVDAVAKIIREKYGRRNSLRKVFRDWDFDKDGMVSKDEMHEILHHMDVKMLDNDFEALYKKFDENGEDGVSYSEFIDFVFPAHPEKDEHIKLQQEQERMRLEAEKIRNVTPGTLEEAMLIEKIKKGVFERLSRKGKGTLSDAFRKFDVDHDGQVTYDEFRNGMKNLDSRLTDGHIDILLSQFDKDSSGSIDYREFVANAAEQSDENIMLQYKDAVRQNTADNAQRSRKRGNTRARRRPATVAGLTLHESTNASLSRAASASNLGSLKSKRNYMPFTERLRRKRLQYIIPPNGSSRERHFHFKDLYRKQHVPRKDSNTPYYDTRHLINMPNEGSSFETRRFRSDHDHGYYGTNISSLHSRPLSRHAGHRQENIEQARSDLKESRRWGRQKRKQQNYARVYKNVVEPNRYRDEDNHEKKLLVC